MKPEEAIENFKGCVVGYEVDEHGNPNGNVTADLTTEIIDMAISALEKQTPKEPKTIEGVCVIRYYCPTCGTYYGQRGTHNIFLFPTPKHCTECGQAIKWEDTK